MRKRGERKGKEEQRIIEKYKRQAKQIAGLQKK
jgi:hypothetical protein